MNRPQEELMETVLAEENLRAAWQQVKEQSNPETLRLRHSMGNRGTGPASVAALVQPPDAENRTSGGVGALTGAIPSGRPDHRNVERSRCAERSCSHAGLRRRMDGHCHSEVTRPRYDSTTTKIHS